MMDKYKQTDEINQDLMKQIEILEEQGDTAMFAEEMKRIYSDRDSYRAGPNTLSHSEKMSQARNKLAISAQKFSMKGSRRSNMLAKVSEELEEDEAT